MTAPTSPTSGESILQAHEVSRAFRMDHEEVTALNAVTLDVRQGERVCITGRSGAGKSTLLNILGGLDRPTEGTVTYRGRDIYALSGRARSRLRAREWGFVFQAFYLIPELTVVENISLPAMNPVVDRTVRRSLRERAEHLGGAVGLGDRLSHRPRELSGGEMQRAALARALMNNPDVIFADEPTGNLDATTGGQILELLLRLSSEQGRTLVVVTHSEAVTKICTRHIRLEVGSCVPASR